MNLTRDPAIPISEREDLDENIWKNLVEDQLYYFEGTRVLAISFQQTDAPVTQDGLRHGAPTSYLVAREAPEAWIVAVQVDPVDCREDTSCHIHPSVAEGMEWIAQQDWIDVVSVSIGFPADAPDPSALHPEAARFVAASEKAASDGKLLVFAAGNDPAPAFTEYFAGPPWIIAVGGVESGGSSVLSAKAADVVANMTEQVPGVLTEELEWRSGTSFAAPVVAGTLANALDIIRRNDPARNATTLEIRAALNASGTYLGPTDWSPVPSGHGPPLIGYVTTATTPVVSQAQMGWGYIDGGMAPEIARRVLENDLAPPPEKQQAILFQAQWQQAREEYWSTAPR